MNTNTMGRLSYLNKIMMAITFAESGEYETAQGLLAEADKKQQRPESRVELRPAMEL